jgi:ATP-binding cassette subfamily C protein/ATP-binding cassette subfamily C exporter for protease/lipase
MIAFFSKYLGDGDVDVSNDILGRNFRTILSLGKPLILYSGIVNMMTFATSLYSMQIFDRVLGSQSKDTLLYLTLAVGLAVGLSTTMDVVRQQTAARAASWFSLRMGPALLARSIDMRTSAGENRQEALRELGRLKTFLSSPTLFNLLDMVWVPFYVAIVFLLHPVFGVICGIGALILLFLTWYLETSTRQDIGANQRLTQSNQQFAECLVRNSEVITAMGMADNTVARWTASFEQENAAADATQEFQSRIIGVTRFVRTLIQMSIMGFGALLVLDLQLTGGSLIAASILSGRLLAPIDASMTYWKQFVLARAGFQRLGKFSRLPSPRKGDMELPAPSGRLTVEGLTFVPQGGPAILRGVSFGIEAGTMLAIIGPSASGKTTLARTLVGVNRPTSGHVRLDGADTFDWKRTDFGRYVGYLPQDVELLPGTIRDNIARFDPSATDASVVAAAKLADCHDLILQLNGGYDCMLTEGGHELSGGQRQRIGLARALYGTPCFVVLDEPNASLDAKGDVALQATLGRLKEARITTVVVSHRSNMLQLSDRLLVMRDGRIANFGLSAAVMRELTGEKPPASAPGRSQTPRARMVSPEQSIPVPGGVAE